MSDSQATSRRGFLKRFGVLGATGLGASTLLSACGGGGDSSSGASTEGSTSSATADAGACNDVSGLTQAEVGTRNNMIETLQYVEESPDPEKLCNNCQLWVPPQGDAACGGCTLIKGPIAPEGYCTSWVAAAAS